MATPILTTIHESNRSSAKISEVVSDEDIVTSPSDAQYPLAVTSNRTMSDIGTYEDWFGSEVVVPRDADRILEQFVLMLLRIDAYLKTENADSIRLFNSNSQAFLGQYYKCTAMPSEETDTPPLVGSSKGRMASYLLDYPQIFGKKPDVLGNLNAPDSNLLTVRSSHSSQSTRSKKGVSTETTDPNLNNATTQDSKHLVINSKENLNDGKV